MPPVSLGRIELLGFPEWPYTGTQTVVIDANNEAAAFIFPAPQAGDITKLGFRTGSVTTGDSVIVSLQTLDATGLPSGTLVNAGATATQVVASSDDDKYFEVTLATPATVTAGQKVALVVSMPASGTVGSMQIMLSAVAVGGYPYVANNSGTWNKLATRGWIGSVRYSDGSYPYIPLLFPLADTTAANVFNNITSATNPDERGNKFTMPMACTVSGLWYFNASNQAGDFDLKLYDSGTTVLGSVSVDGDLGNTSTTLAIHLFAGGPVDLRAGDVVRATKLPTSGTVATASFLMQSQAGVAGQYPYGSWVQHTDRNDAGAWNDVANRQDGIGLILAGMDDGNHLKTRAWVY